MSKTEKLGKNFALLTVGSFGSKILTFLLVPLYTSVLSTAEYGVVDIINTTVSLVYPLAILVISEAVIRFCLDSESDLNQVWTISMVITFLGCCLMLLLSPIVLLTSFRKYYVLFILHAVAMSFESTISQFVKGLNNVRQYAIGGVLSTTIIIFCNILFLLLFRWGLTGYIVALFLGRLLCTCYYVFSLKLWKFFISIRKIDIGLVKKMLCYSIPMIPNSISWWISNSSDKYIVQYFCGIAVNGIYAVAYKIPSLLTTASTLFISAWQISAFEEFDSEKSKKFFNTVTNEFVRLNFVVASGLVFMTRPLARVLFANEFYDAWRFTPVLILAYVFSTISSFFGTVYTAAKRTKMLFYSTTVAAITNIILDILMTPKMGAMGAAIATAISYLIICVMRIVDSRKIMKLSIEWKKIVPTMALVILQIFIMTNESLIAFFLCGILMLIVIMLNRAIFVKYAKMLISKIKH